MSDEAVAILEARDLRKEFGGLVAVDDVSIRIRPRSLHSIIGPNGAGKTTLFNLLSGSMAPTRGRVFLREREITGLPAHRLAHLGLGRSYQITNIFPHLSVLENLRIAAQARGRDSFRLLRRYDAFERYLERARDVIAQVGLSGRENVPALALPHGDKRKLELGIMLAGDPEVLLLDEPTAGMSSDQVPGLLEIIHKIRESGERTVVLVEHRMDVVMSISDVITVMHQGSILAEGSPEAIAADPQVQSAYLGALYGDFGLEGTGA
ncbi:MAG: ABC transporter ATP-binding protein [Spirochaetales bacterium]|nr:ABC transporter ATP-binding protein [Spirochaetales bacterium]